MGSFRKALAVTLCAILAASLVACGINNTSKNDAEQTERRYSTLPILSSDPANTNGEPTDNESTSVPETDTDAIDTNKNEESKDSDNSDGDNTDTDTSAPPVQITPMTREEWDSAFDALVTASSISESIETRSVYDNGTVVEYSSLQKLADGNKCYQSTTSGGQTSETYYANIDGVNYRYTNSNGVWTRKVYDSSVSYTNSAAAESMAIYKGLYGKLTFNADTGTYSGEDITFTYSETNTAELLSITIEFKEGKLHKLTEVTEILQKGENGIITAVGRSYATLTLTDYNTTTIELPNV
ncbi:MAG: hypothetical protein IJY08_01930 [Clostridia bacterium]|nr:hypothetical protein [Clostridia bacterium]